jgi:peptidyl-prolyl cis-trans isomerase D
MITFFRRLFNSRIGAIFALIFVVMIGLAFALGDVTGSGSFGGLGQGNVAQVGNQKIGLGELQDSVENRLRAEQRQNPTLDRARFVDSGGLDDTLEQLVNRYALALFGGNHGVSVSEKMVNQEVLKIPGAVGSDGKFNQAAFASFLQNLNLTEKMVRDDFRQNFYARQLLSTAAPGAKAPAGMALPYASLDLEKRAGEVAVISASAFIPANPPSDAILNQYYRANSVRYTVPEKRAISYALFDASVVDAKATPSTEEIAAFYKTNAAKYAATQARDIAQLVFPTQAAAKAASDKITGGKSIQAVAQELGLSVTSSAGITREALTKSASKAVADAVFATAQNAVSVPARGQLGYYVVSVAAIKNITARPLAMVSAEISAELKDQKKQELLGDLTAEIENAFEDGSTLADIAKEQGLKIETTPKLLANGQNPANPGYKPIAEMQQIIPDAFQMETDGSAQLVQIEEGKRFALVSVADFDEAAPAPLGEIKNIVLQQWAMSEGNKKAKTVAEQVRKAVLSGQSLSAALAAAGATGAKIEMISSTRGDLNKASQKGAVPPPLALMFAMKKGTAKSIQAPNDRGWFVVRLNEVVRGDASADVERVESNRKELQTLLSQEYAAQLIASAKKEMGVELNKATIKTLRDTMTGKNQQ